jgi:hypothetical protein
MNNNAPNTTAVREGITDAPVSVRLLFHAIDILEPEIDFDNVMVELGLSDNGVLHAPTHDDPLEALVATMMGKTAICAKQNNVEILSLSSLLLRTVCETCSRFRPLHTGLVDDDLREAVSTVIALNVFRLEVNNEKFNTFIKNSDTYEIIQALYSLLAHHVSRQLEYDTTDLPSNEIYSKSIIELMDNQFQSFASFAKHFTGEKSVEKLRLWHGLNADPDQTLNRQDIGDALVVFESLLFSTVELEKEKECVDADTSDKAMTDPKLGRKYALALQYAFEPDSFRTKRACVVPTWVVQAVERLAPDQKLSATYTRLDGTTLDTAKRLYNPDRASVYSSLEECVKAAHALHRE